MADIAEQCWRAAASQGPPAAFFSIESSRGGVERCVRVQPQQLSHRRRHSLEVPPAPPPLNHPFSQLQIPVQLRLAENEVSSLEHPPVLYFLVPRQSYLHSLVPRALQMLEHLLPPGDHVPWFEHAHLPLKWGVPAGVLYDLVAAPSAELPWRLTIHFRSYPDRLLAAYGGEAALRASFFTSLKEAACICRGSAQRVMEMAAGAQEDLWRQVVSSSLQPYSQVMASLQLAPVAQRGGRPPAIPIRLYVRQGVGGYLSSYEDISVTSRPVEALAADGSAVTLRQALLPLLAECVTGSRGADSTAASLTVPATLLAASSGSTTLVGNDRGSLEAATASSDAKPAAEPEVGAALVEAGSGAAESGDASSPARDSTSNAAGHDETGVGGATESTCLLEASVAQRRLLVAGTTPPLDAPLAWLHAQLHAPDFFLYIVLHAGR